MVINPDALSNSRTQRKRLYFRPECMKLRLNLSMFNHRNKNYNMIYF